MGLSFCPVTTTMTLTKSSALHTRKDPSCTCLLFPCNNIILQLQFKIYYLMSGLLFVSPMINMNCISILPIWYTSPLVNDSTLPGHINCFFSLSWAVEIDLNFRSLNIIFQDYSHYGSPCNLNLKGFHSFNSGNTRRIVFIFSC